ncbi:hypothetical protein B5S28_g2636 [[Candida] boidinii]|nr:hypothetical protein B5S28_g2636 [[Candida] boidinii]OWB60091.1 hypothetical protein B5S29_g959 [[Candida] boidinii]
MFQFGLGSHTQQHQQPPTLFDIRITSQNKNVIFIRGTQDEASPVRVTGHVVLSLPESINLKKISLNLMGSYKLDFLETFNENSQNKKSLINSIKEETVIFKSAWDNVLTNKSGIIKIGNYGDTVSSSANLFDLIDEDDQSQSQKLDSSTHSSSSSSSSRPKFSKKISNGNILESSVVKFTDSIPMGETPFPNYNSASTASSSSSSTTASSTTSPTFMLPKGNYSFPFEIILPGNIPETVEGLQCGAILYRFESKIEGCKNYKNLPICHKYIRIFRQPNPTDYIVTEDCSIENIWPGKIQYELRLPRKAITLGGKCKIHILIIPLIKNLKLDKISVGLKQYFMLKSLHKKKEVFEDEKLIYKIDLPKIDQSELPLDKWSLEAKITLPKKLKQCSPDINIKDNLIKIRHKLTINITLLNPDNHTSLIKSKIPIVLYTSPKESIIARNAYIDPHGKVRFRSGHCVLFSKPTSQNSTQIQSSTNTTTNSTAANSSTTSSHHRETLAENGLLPYNPSVSTTVPMSPGPLPTEPPSLTIAAVNAFGNKNVNDFTLNLGTPPRQYGNATTTERTEDNTLIGSSPSPSPSPAHQNESAILGPPPPPSSSTSSSSSRPTNIMIPSSPKFNRSNSGVLHSSPGATLQSRSLPTRSYNLPELHIDQSYEYGNALAEDDSNDEDSTDAIIDDDEILPSYKDSGKDLLFTPDLMTFSPGILTPAVPGSLSGTHTPSYFDIPEHNQPQSAAQQQQQQQHHQQGGVPASNERAVLNGNYQLNSGYTSPNIQFLSRVNSSTNLNIKGNNSGGTSGISLATISDQVPEYNSIYDDDPVEEDEPAPLYDHISKDKPFTKITSNSLGISNIVGTSGNTNPSSNISNRNANNITIGTKSVNQREFAEYLRKKILNTQSNIYNNLDETTEVDQSSLGVSDTETTITANTPKVEELTLASSGNSTNGNSKSPTPPISRGNPIEELGTSLINNHSSKLRRPQTGSIKPKSQPATSSSSPSNSTPNSTSPSPSSSYLQLNMHAKNVPAKYSTKTKRLSTSDLNSFFKNKSGNGSAVSLDRIQHTTTATTTVANSSAAPDSTISSNSNTVSGSANSSKSLPNGHLRSTSFTKLNFGRLNIAKKPNK